MTEAEGLRTRALRGLASWSVRHPRWVLGISLLICLGSLAAAFGGLGLKTSNLDLIDPDIPEVQSFHEFSERFGNPNSLVIALDGDDPHHTAEAVEWLSPRLKQLAEVESVFDRSPQPADVIEVLGLNPYLRSEDGRLHVIFVTPRDKTSSTEAAAPFVEAVRGLIDQRPASITDVQVGLTGIPVYALDDQQLVQAEISRLSGFGALLVLLIFVTAFAAWRRPLAALVALVGAVLATVGVASIWPGHLTLISAFFGSILFGLGIDFAIHLIDRAEFWIARGRPTAEAVPKAVAELAEPLVTGAVTSASAFFAMAFSGFRGFAELGWIAGVGLLVALLATVTVLPALLRLFGRPAQRARKAPRPSRIVALLQALQGRYSAGLVALAVVVLGALALATGRPAFDTDYLALQPSDSEAVHWERELVARSQWSPQFAAFTVDSRDQLLGLIWQLSDEETVGAVRSIRDLEIGGMPGLVPDLPEEALRPLVAEDGTYAVYAYPSGDIWNADFQDQFLSRLRNIDPDVTGLPFVGRLLIDRSRRALEITAQLATALLFLAMLWDFRSLKWALLAMTPAIGAAVATAGLMACLGLDFHPLNVMALPVVLGIAVDDGVHMVHRLRRRGSPEELIGSAGRGIVLTSWTNLAAFGVLMLTHHPGLASFATVLCLGVASALLISTLALPQLILWLDGRQARCLKAEPPIETSASPAEAERRDGAAPSLRI